MHGGMGGVLTYSARALGVCLCVHVWGLQNWFPLYAENEAAFNQKLGHEGAQRVMDT